MRLDHQIRSDKKRGYAQHQDSATYGGDDHVTDM
jgi:hypothetical protein